MPYPRVEGYDALPESIKAMYSEKEYAWLSDAEKQTLVERETEPEVADIP